MESDSNVVNQTPLNQSNDAPKVDYNQQYINQMPHPNHQIYNHQYQHNPQQISNTPINQESTSNSSKILRRILVFLIDAILYYIIFSMAKYIVTDFYLRLEKGLSIPWPNYLPPTITIVVCAFLSKWVEKFY